MTTNHEELNQLEYSILHKQELSNFSPRLNFSYRNVCNRFRVQSTLSSYFPLNTKLVIADKTAEINKFRQFANYFSYAENETKCLKSHTLFRARIAKLDWLKPLLSSDSEVRSNTNNISDVFPSAAGATYTTSTRLHLSLPVAFVTYYVSSIIAYSKSARSFINSKADDGYKIPRILMEKLKSVRQSQCNDFLVLPETGEHLTDDYLSIMGFEKTIFDTSWLLSQDGIERIFNLFSLLQNSPNNYIDMVPFDKGMPFKSGTFTTEGCISITSLSTFNPTSTPIITKANLLPGNAYGRNVNGVQIADAFVLTHTVYLASNPNTQVDLFGYSPDFESQFNSDDRALYVLHRTTTLENDIKTKKPVTPSAQSPEKAAAVDENEATLTFENIRDGIFNSSNASKMLSMLLVHVINDKTLLQAIAWYINKLLPKRKFIKKQKQLHTATA